MYVYACVYIYNYIIYYNIIYTHIILYTHNLCNVLLNPRIDLSTTYSNWFWFKSAMPKAFENWWWILIREVYVDQGSEKQ